MASPDTKFVIKTISTTNDESNKQERTPQVQQLKISRLSGNANEYQDTGSSVE